MRCVIVFALLLSFAYIPPVHGEPVIHKKGDTVIIAMSCKTEEVIRHVAEGDEKSLLDTLNIFKAYHKVKMCEVYPIFLEVEIGELLHVYTDYEDNILQVWSYIDEYGRVWYTII
jgi:hypothetical protein